MPIGAYNPMVWPIHVLSHNSRWQPDEITLYIYCLRTFGKDYRRIHALLNGAKSITAVQSWYTNYRKKRGLDRIPGLGLLLAIFASAICACDVTEPYATARALFGRCHAHRHIIHDDTASFRSQG